MSPILLAALFLILSNQAIASTKCFIAKDGDNIIAFEGDCSQRTSPCSTFKIPLSLIGYNEKLLLNITQPQWDYKPEYASSRAVCQQSTNPATWIKNSCIWYSQAITQNIGMPKFKQYVTQFHYGNQDVSGDIGKNNGLTQAWLSSSLTISPFEQILFLEKLVNSKLPVSLEAHEHTRKLLLLEELPHGWKLYGKTGSGDLITKEGNKKKDLQTGWFIGWLEKDQRKIIFAHYIEDENKEEISGGLRAKAAAKEKLLALFNN